MEPTILSGNSMEAIEAQLAAYLQQQEAAFEHQLLLQQGASNVLLEVDIDPGGGFESGYAVTRFSVPVTAGGDFAFTIYPQGFLADFAKLFGLQDEELGYPEFDKKVIVKTNNKEKATAVFKDAAARQTFSRMDTFNLHLKGADENHPRRLVLEIEEGITETAALMNLYKAFINILEATEAVETKI